MANLLRFETLEAREVLDAALSGGAVLAADGLSAVDDSYSVESSGLLMNDVLMNDDYTATPETVATVVDGPDEAVFFQLHDDGSFTYAPMPGFEGTDTFSYKIVDTQEESNVATVTITVGESASEILNRAIFYNNSAFDGQSDDDAIAPDKQALLPGQTASFLNYTSYSKGINGIIVDIDKLAGTLTAADFEFRVGNSNTPSTWANGPAPESVTVRHGEGLGGTDRVVIAWADQAIVNEWLQVTIVANENTGLGSDDVFYFGNATGEAGNSPTNAMVTAADEILARNFRHGILNPAEIDDAHDFNRDKMVNTVDRLIARSNRTNLLSALRLIDAPVISLQTAEMSSSESLGVMAEKPPSVDTSASTPTVEVGWISQIDTSPATSEAHKSARQAIDVLLATFNFFG